MLVVLFHMLVQVDWLYNPLPSLVFGAGGVDIFFIISGFVMFVAARHERPSDFFLKRILRIAPLYWLVTLVFFGMRHAHFGDPGIDLPAIIKSLLFIPYRVGASNAPVQPFLVPGWSLNIEIFFYFLFGVGLTVRRPALFSGLAIIATVLAGFIVKPSIAAFDLYSSPILLEFAAGLLLGHLWTTNRLPCRLWPLMFIGFMLLLGCDLFGNSRVFVRGVGGVLVMIGAVAAEDGVCRVRQPMLKALGDASYSIYLVHVPLLLVFFSVVRRVPLHGLAQFVVYLFVGLVLCAAGGLAMHRWVERPLTGAVRRLVVRRR
jgi:exopolysaccharide production protein ExoZ